jgi:hypothetical protein
VVVDSGSDPRQNSAGRNRILREHPSSPTGSGANALTFGKARTGAALGYPVLTTEGRVTEVSLAGLLFRGATPRRPTPPREVDYRSLASTPTGFISGSRASAPARPALQPTLTTAVPGARAKAVKFGYLA